MAQHSSGSPPLILVVEENDGVRNLLENALPMLGFRVAPAGNGKEALETFRQHAAEIELVLMDVNMDGMDGLECTLRLRALECDRQEQARWLSSFMRADRVWHCLPYSTLVFHQAPRILQTKISKRR